MSREIDAWWLDRLREAGETAIIVLSVLSIIAMMGVMGYALLYPSL